MQNEYDKRARKYPARHHEGMEWGTEMPGGVYMRMATDDAKGKPWQNEKTIRILRKGTRLRGLV